MRLSEERCQASRDFFDVCLADKEDKETIIPAGAWAELRPDNEVVYIEGKRWVRVLFIVTGEQGGACPVSVHDVTMIGVNPATRFIVYFPSLERVVLIWRWLLRHTLTGPQPHRANAHRSIGSDPPQRTTVVVNQTLYFSNGSVVISPASGFAVWVGWARTRPYRWTRARPMFKRLSPRV